MTTVKRLRELLSKATPGPVCWTQTRPMSIAEQCEYMAEHLSYGVEGPLNGIGCPEHPRTIIGDDSMQMVEFATCGNGPNAENNARLLVATVNLLPALLDVAEAAERMRAEWTSKHIVNTPLDLRVVEVIMALDALDTKGGSDAKAN